MVWKYTLLHVKKKECTRRFIDIVQVRKAKPFFNISEFSVLQACEFTYLLIRRFKLFCYVRRHREVLVCSCKDYVAINILCKPIERIQIGIHLSCKFQNVILLFFIKRTCKATQNVLVKN